MRTELYGFHVVEEYEEVLERNPKKISICWQLSHILFYSLSAISGYVCTFMFEVLWVCVDTNKIVIFNNSSFVLL